MIDDRPQHVDVGEYCRQVEDHLTRVNGGHLVRIVGPGFELVRGWAHEGIPVSFVMRGIDAKAERHHSGRSTRPLRIEFCEADVRAIFENWRRAVGLAGPVPDAGAVDRRRPSLSRHLDRASDALGRTAGRLDLPGPLREALAAVLAEVADIHERARHARGSARTPLVERLAALDRQLLDAALGSIDAGAREALVREAEGELAPFRERLPADIWRRSVDVTVDRLLRDRFGLPTLDLDR